jgi:hypothetical protein
MKEELQKSGTEGLSQKQMEEKRLEILKRLREEEIAKLGGEHSIAGFDHILLRERLKNVTPLQQLYERVFFDDYDLAAACRPYDSFKDCKEQALTLPSDCIEELLQAGDSEGPASDPWRRRDTQDPHGV